MSGLLPIDLTEVILDDLRQGDRQDGLLHASSHLFGSQRHAQLEIAGAPKLPRSFGSALTLQIGTLIHRWVEDMLRDLGLPFMAEVNLNPWLPKGWGGTADIVMWSPEDQAFVLVDLKTSKGESIKWRAARGASDEHVWQTSMYWHGLRKMGIPLARKIGVIYLPKNDVKGEEVEPLTVEFEPIAAKKIAAVASQRRKGVETYRKSLPKPNPRPLHTEEFLTEELAPVQERVEKIVTRYGEKKLVLVPHWSAAFCPFPDELCDCNTQGTTTVGTFDADGDFWPSKGHEDYEPAMWPEEAE